MVSAILSSGCIFLFSNMCIALVPGDLAHWIEKCEAYDKTQNFRARAEVSCPTTNVIQIDISILNSSGKLLRQHTGIFREQVGRLEGNLLSTGDVVAPAFSDGKVGSTLRGPEVRSP